MLGVVIVENNEATKQKVREALANKKYTWRTVRGIATEAGLKQDDVRGVITELGTAVVKSSIPSESGEDLFAAADRLHEAVPTNDDRTAVLSALEDSKFTWRTLKGIAAQTRLPESKVMEIIQSNRDLILKSEIPSTDGLDLYTTRKHYLDQSGVVGKMMGFYHARLV